MYHAIFLRLLPFLFTLYWSPLLFAQDEEDNCSMYSALSETAPEDVNLDDIIENLEPETRVAIAELEDSLNALSSEQRAFISDCIMRLTQAVQTKQSLQEKHRIYNQLSVFTDTKLQDAFRVYWDKLEGIEPLQTLYEKLWYGQKIQSSDVTQQTRKRAIYDNPTREEIVIAGITAGIFVYACGTVVPSFFGMPWLSAILLAPGFIFCCYHNCCAP